MAFGIVAKLSHLRPVPVTPCIKEARTLIRFRLVAGGWVGGWGSKAFISEATLHMEVSLRVEFWAFSGNPLLGKINRNPSGAETF